MGSVRWPTARFIKPRRHAACFVGGYHVGAFCTARGGAQPEAARFELRGDHRAPHAPADRCHACQPVDDAHHPPGRRPADRARGRPPLAQPRPSGGRDDQALCAHRSRRRGISRLCRDRPQQRSLCRHRPHQRLELLRPWRLPPRGVARQLEHVPFQRHPRRATHHRLRDRRADRPLWRRLRQSRRDPGCRRPDHDRRRCHRAAGAGVRRRWCLTLSLERYHRPDRHRQRWHRICLSPGRLSLSARPPRDVSAPCRTGHSLQLRLDRSSGAACPASSSRWWSVRDRAWLVRAGHRAGRRRGGAD